MTGMVLRRTKEVRRMIGMIQKMMDRFGRENWNWFRQLDHTSGERLPRRVYELEVESRRSRGMS